MVWETLSLHHYSTPGFFHLLNGRKDSAAYSPHADGAVLARPLSFALIGTERAGDIRVSNWFMYLCTRNTDPHSWGKKKTSLRKTLTSSHSQAPTAQPGKGTVGRSNPLISPSLPKIFHDQILNTSHGRRLTVEGVWMKAGY